MACETCTAPQTCAADVCSGGGKRIFVTAAAYSANLGGLSGADQKCNLAAQGANLGGTWKAWLSDGTVNAIERITDVGPWFLVGTATRAFNNKANLTTIPLNAIERNEQGTLIPGGSSVQVWTGTSNGGVRTTNTCTSWTSTTAFQGDTGTAQSASAWTAGSPAYCQASCRMYCIEQ